MAGEINIFGKLVSAYVVGDKKGPLIAYSAVGNAPKPAQKTIVRNPDGTLSVNFKTVVPTDLSKLEQVKSSEIETTEQKKSGMLYIDFGGNPKKISLEQIGATSSGVTIVYDEDARHLQIK